MKRILLIHTAEDYPYLVGFNKSYIPDGWKLSVVADHTIGDKFLTQAAAASYDAIVTDSEYAVAKAFTGRGKISLGNYVGSYKTLGNGIPLLVVPALCNKYSVPYQDFLVKRLIKKITAPQTYITTDAFKFFTPQTTPDFYLRIQAAIASATFMAIDTETLEDSLRIDDCGIACWNYETGTQVFSWSIRDAADVALIRQACDSKAIKIFQNGKYDCHYLFRFDCWPRNWKLDTLNLFHCWLSELPKDLAFISAFCIKDFYYWKDESKSPFKLEQLQYNAKDCWATLWSAFALMKEMPAWARKNYGIQFPKVFPNLMSSLSGMRVDQEKRVELIYRAEAEITDKVDKLRVLVGNSNFNPNSPQQVQKLLKVLKVKDTSSGDAKHIAKAIAEHPLNARIFADYLSIKELGKLNSTYYKTSLFSGRLFWVLNEAATDTGRNASKSSSFWCGTQMQNQPEEAKIMYLSEEPAEGEEPWIGFEADLSQAESRCTGYLADDEKLIWAVENSPDFHSQNASAFFGIPFDDIWDTEIGEAKDKPLRDLSKRVNHGANYNMGAKVLVDTMGVENVWNAHRLLGLSVKFPKIKWTTLKIAEHLLAQFDKTYTKIRGEFQDEIKREVLLTGHLTGIRGWTRKVFGDPTKSKPLLNSLVAHSPQNLSAMIINDAWERAWWELHDPKDFRLIVSIHDSILGQYRGESGKAKLDRLLEIMHIPVTVPRSGKTFIIPAALEVWGDRWKKEKVKAVKV